MLVSMFMSPDVVSVTSREDAHTAAALMAKYGMRCLPVIDEERLVGVLSKSDLLRFAPSRFNPFSAEAIARKSLGFDVADGMRTRVVTAAPDEPVEAAARRMVSEQVNMVVVVKREAVVGVLTRTDILRAFREMLFTPDATCFTLQVAEGVDLAARVLNHPEAQHLELRSYTEHRHGDKRFVFIALAGSKAAVRQVVEDCWIEGVQVLQVRHPAQPA